VNLHPLDPRGWFGRKDALDSTRNQGGMLAAAQRQSSPMGAWSGVIGQWQPRARSPYLLEALREAIPILDGGINRLVTLDGILTVEGDNDALVQEIDTWMRNVPVNDLECGYQAFYAGQGAEHYEQGVGLGEFVYDRRGRDVIGLRVADSKGLAFVRETDRLRVFYRTPEAPATCAPMALARWSSCCLAPPAEIPSAACAVRDLLSWTRASAALPCIGRRPTTPTGSASCAACRLSRRSC